MSSRRPLLLSPRQEVLSEVLTAALRELCLSAPEFGEVTLRAVIHDSILTRVGSSVETLVKVPKGDHEFAAVKAEP